MPLPPEITLEEFRQVVDMLQTAISGMSALADRVKALEEANNAYYGTAVAMRDAQQSLFEAYKAQQELNVLFKQSLDTLMRAIGNYPTTIQ